MRGVCFLLGQLAGRSVDTEGTKEEVKRNGALY